MLDLNGLKCKLDSVYAADFSKQASNVQDTIEMIQERELNQALIEVTKLHLILTILVTFASGEIVFFTKACKELYEVIPK